MRLPVSDEWLFPEGRPLFSWRHALIPFVAACVVGALYHGWFLLEAPPIWDEVIYVAAMNAAQAGLPTTGVTGYFYPDYTARLLGGLAGVLGSEVAVIRVMRIADLAGVALVAALSGLAAGRRPAPWIAMALVLTPPATATIVEGNVSGILAGLVLMSTLVRRRISEILWLIPSIGLLKPYGLGLALSRAPVVAVVGGAAAVAALLASAHSTLPAEALTNVSPYRLFRELSIPMMWQIVTVIFLLAAGLLGRGNTLRAATLGVMALPIIWPHTRLLVFPALAWALRAQAERWPEPLAKLHIAWLVLAGVVLIAWRWAGLPDVSTFYNVSLLLVTTASFLYVAWLAPKDATVRAIASIAR